MGELENDKSERSVTNEEEEDHEVRVSEKVVGESDSREGPIVTWPSQKQPMT